MKRHFGFRNADFRLPENEDRQFAIRNSQSRGFTLIELMVVLLIMGIMLTIVIPRLGEIGEANLKRSARHLTGVIRYLRDESQAKKAVYRLRFDIQGNRYWAEVMTFTTDKTVEFKKLQTEIGTEGGLAGQTTFRDVQAASHPDDPFIQFTPDGWVENAMIHLKDGSDRDFTLMVNPLTGGTELRDGYIEERP